MYDVEKQILHDANNLFVIRVVALDWTKGFVQYPIYSPWHIKKFLDEECGLGAWPGFKGFIKTCIRWFECSTSSYMRLTPLVVGLT